MPFDQTAAVAVAADAARTFTEGLRGLVVKAQEELNADRQRFEDDRKKLEEERRQLDQDRQRFEQERAAFDRERGTFDPYRQNFVASRLDAVDRSEIVTLNVGGEANVTVFRSTLMQCPKSRFTVIFGQNSAAPKDAEGRIFVDFKPALFMPLLDHLRMRQIEEPNDPTPPPKLDSVELDGQFQKMLQFYQLKDWVNRRGQGVLAGAAAAVTNLFSSRSQQFSPRIAPAHMDVDNGLSAIQQNGSPQLRDLGMQQQQIVTSRQPSLVNGGAAQPVVSPRQPPAAVVSIQTVLQEPMQKVAEAEAAIQKIIGAAAPLGPGQMESLAADTLKAAVEQILEAEKVAALSIAEAKKLLMAKQKDEQAKAVPGFTAEMQKMIAKLNAGQQEVLKQRKVALNGDKVWKAKVAQNEKAAQAKQLQEHQKKLEAALQEPIKKVTSAEAAVQTLIVVAASIAGEHVVENMDLGKLKQVVEQTLEAEKAAAVACAEARKILMALQKDENMKALPSFDVEMPKLLAQLNTVQQEIPKQRKIALQADKIVKHKAAEQAKEAQAKQLEAVLTAPRKKVCEADAMVKKMMEDSAVLTTDQAEQLASGRLKELVDKAFEAEKATAVVCGEARKVLMACQKDEQAKALPGFDVEFPKLIGQLNTAQQELQRLRKFSLQGEKLWKNKIFLQEKGDSVKNMEIEVDQLEITVASPSLTDDSIKEKERSLDALFKRIGELTKALQTSLPNLQGNAKTEIMKLVQRTNQTQARFSKMRLSIKEQRDRMLCDAMLREARARVDKLTSAFQQVSKVEGNYPEFKKISTAELPKFDADAKAASLAVQQAIDGARATCASKNLEVKKLSESVAKPGAQEIEVMAKNIDEAVKRLNDFKKAMKERREKIQCEAILQAARTQMEKVEVALQRMTQAGLGAASDATCQAASTAAQQAIAEARSFAVSKTVEMKRYTDGTSKTALQEMASFSKRVDEANENLTKFKGEIKERADRAKCDAVLADGRAKMDKVEAAFQALSSTDRSAEIECQAASVAVQQAINEARSFIVSRSLEVKRFAEAVSKVGVEEMNALSKRNDEFILKLSNFKKEIEGQKRAVAYQEANSRVADAEEAVQKTCGTAAPLTSQKVDDLTPEAAGEIIEQINAEAVLATEKFDAARQFLAERQRDTVGKIEAGDLSKLMSRLNTMQVDLAKAKASATDYEHRLVAQMILQEAGEAMVELEAETDKAVKAAVQLVDERGKCFIVTSMAKMILEALGETEEDVLFGENGLPQEGDVTEADFIAFLGKIPTLCGRPDLAFKPEQCTAIFQQVDRDKDGKIQTTDFIEMFVDRYICTTETPVTEEIELTSTAVGKLKVEEIAEALGEPTVEPTSGATRVEVRVLSGEDEITGWATIKEQSGTAHLALFSSYQEFIRDLDRTMDGAQETVSRVSELLDAKHVDLKGAKPGPLTEAKAELTKMSATLSATRAKFDQLKKKVDDEKRTHAKREEFEKRKQEEKQRKKQEEKKNEEDRVTTAAALAEISEKHDKVVTALLALGTEASPLTGADMSDPDSVPSPISTRSSAQIAVQSVDSAIADTRGCLAKYQPEAAAASQGPWFELKQELATRQQQLDDIAKQAKQLLDSVHKAYKALAVAKREQIAAAIRNVVRKEGGDKRTEAIDALYAEVVGDASIISEEALFRYVDSLDGLNSTPEQRTMVFENYDTIGMNKRAFTALCEQYARCTADIPITSDFDIKESVPVRKLEVGEYVEILEGQRDEENSTDRVHAKALVDGVVGWVTFKGQGTQYLQECSKPHFVASDTVKLEDGFASEGCNEVCTLKAGEVIEVLEGPRKEEVSVTLRARVKAFSDGSTGWFTKKSKHGEEFSEAGKVTYTCTAPIALTDIRDIKECNVVRKLEKGEIMLVLEGPVEDDSQGTVTRLKIRAVKGGAEGWVTIKGNAGTVYAEESGSHHILTKSIPLHTDAKVDTSLTLRMLAEQELVQILETKEEKSEPATRVRGCSLRDDKVGWCTVRNGNLKQWSSTYKCLQTTTLTDGPDASQASAVRELQVGEHLQLLEVPREVSPGVVRLKARADKDDAVGWVSVSGIGGRPLFVECVLAS